MYYYVYILYSKKLDRYYTGHTWNPEKRLKRHNAGKSRSTKAGIPWEIKYIEEFPTRRDAIKRENEIKRWKNRKMIEELVRAQLND